MRSEFFSTSPTDLPRGSTRLFRVGDHRVFVDPTSGHLFLFVNRRHDHLQDSLLGSRRSGDQVQTTRNRLVSAPTRSLAMPRCRWLTTQLSLILSGIDLQLLGNAGGTSVRRGRKIDQFCLVMYRMNAYNSVHDYSSHGRLIPANVTTF